MVAFIFAQFFSYISNKKAKYIEFSEKMWYNNYKYFLRCEVMYISYKKLWKLLIDRNMKKKELAEKSGVSIYTLSKMGHNESITTDILVKICRALDCELQDICEIEKEDMSNTK